MTNLIPKKTTRKAIKLFEKAKSQAVQPPPRLSLPDWADKYRRLSTSSGAIGGPWRTSRVEVARGPMMAVKERGVKTITIKSCTQLLKTSLLENVIGYHAHLDPCPILLTQPKEGAVKSFSKERLAPMARATPVLRDLLGDERTRRGEDTLSYKEFPGGFLAMESAGSPTNLAMRAIRITCADEIDKYETTKEGDPVILLEERTSTYNRTNSLHIRTCSPTWEETSRINKSYNESDMRRPFVACPHCEYEQTLDFFRHVEWSKSDEGEHFPFTAAIYCENCGEEWTEAQRMQLMTTRGAIRWRQTKPFVCCDVRQEPMKTRRWKWDAKNQVGLACCETCGKQGVSNMHAGFTCSKLYSPFITVPELAEKWILAKDDPETKQTFYNTQLGMAFAAQALRKIESHGLASRREEFKSTVPYGVLLLSAGIDVQAGSKVNEGRIEVEVVGWGLGEESWSIAHKVFTGDPAKPAIWQELDAFLLQGFEYEGGGHMAVRAACIDTGGYNTEEAYKFARARVNRNIWAVKGAAERGGQWSPVWPVPKQESKKTRRTGYKPIILGVNSAKEAIRQKLLVDEPGPGYAHFPMERSEGWFEQLTSEQLIVEKKSGFSSRKWHLPRGRANEALDCRVYAYAALCGLYAVRKVKLERLSEVIETFRVEAAEKLAHPNSVAAKTPEERPSRVRRSNWVQ